MMYDSSPQVPAGVTPSEASDIVAAAATRGMESHAITELY